MNFSTDEQRNQSLGLLRETAEYLRRLPAVPVTREIIARIEAHLAEPSAKLTQQRLYSYVGSVYDPGGEELFEARLVGTELTFSARKPGQIISVAHPLRISLSVDQDPPPTAGPR